MQASNRAMPTRERERERSFGGHHHGKHYERNTNIQRVSGQVKVYTLLQIKVADELLLLLLLRLLLLLQQ